MEESHKSVELWRILVDIGAMMTGAESRRSIAQGAVKVNGVRITNPTCKVNGSHTVKIGKRRLYEVRVKEGKAELLSHELITQGG